MLSIPFKQILVTLNRADTQIASLSESHAGASVYCITTHK